MTITSALEPANKVVLESELYRFHPEDLPSNYKSNKDFE
jgi:hypothetical protein